MSGECVGKLVGMSQLVSHPLVSETSSGERVGPGQMQGMLVAIRRAWRQRSRDPRSHEMLLEGSAGSDGSSTNSAHHKRRDAQQDVPADKSASTVCSVFEVALWRPCG